MGTARHRREVTLQPLSFFNFNLSGNKNLRQQRNTPFSTSLVTWIESPWSWDSKGPLKISRKWRSEVVKSGWEGCEPISMRPDPDWQGSYTISSPDSQSTYTSCSVSAHCWLLSSWSRHQTTHISITRRENKQAQRSSCELLRQNIVELHGSSSASS